MNFPGSNNFSIINAQPLLQVYSAGIRNYDAAKNGYITNEQFKKLLYWVAFAHYQGGDNTTLIRTSSGTRTTTTSAM